MDRATLEMLASGVTSHAGFADPTRLGRAKAELIRRDREYAEQQEQSRREFEMARFNAESDRDVKRKQFEEALAERQMAHATSLAKEQLGGCTIGSQGGATSRVGDSIRSGCRDRSGVIAAIK